MMRKSYNIGLSIMILGVTSLSAFEVNTHQAITRCAIDKVGCKNKGILLRSEGSQNLYNFAEDTFFSKKDYKDTVYKGYQLDGKPAKYVEYATQGEGFTKYKIETKSNYLGLIEAGVVLEDSVYSDNLFGGDGRFNNHFYAAQFNSKKVCAKIAKARGLLGAGLGIYLGGGAGGAIAAASIQTGEQFANYMQTDKALCAGYGERTDNITWALKKNMDLGNGRQNYYGLDDAFDYYKKSFEGNAHDRKENQAKLFVSLGFLIHLIQDLHSPAHVRDGSHPGGDYLEIYGRYNGGFNLVNGKLNPANNVNIEKAIHLIDMKKTMLTNNKYASYQDFFTHEAMWVSKNFMSEAHGLDGDQFKDINNSTGEGLELDEDEIDEKSTTIFDKYNPHLSRNEVDESYIDGAETHLFGDKKWFHLTTKGAIEKDNEKGYISKNSNIVALRYKGYFGYENETMSMITDGSGSLNPAHTDSYSLYNTDALEDTAVNVMSRAVVSSEAFINYFFRGRMKVSLSENEKNITIENISEPQWVSSADLCTFKQGMKVLVSYIDDQNISQPLLDNITLTKDIAIGETYTINGIKLDNLSPPMGDKKQIAVLLDGQLGEKKGLDDSKYNIGARGLVVAYASSRVANADILFSFDKSGSMGSDIENAKTSAKSILTNVVGVDNNSTYIQIEAFNGGASVLLAYDNNVTKVKAKIDTIFSGGGTALYDAIKLAGNSAVAHKNTNNTPKSIVILYTDGQENSSSTTKQQAINAISNANATEIDEVFLIHVGNGGGASELNDIALQAGRKYLKVDNASALEDAISKILRGQ
jgi:Mg-chelatase subunit ChlD